MAVRRPGRPEIAAVSGGERRGFVGGHVESPEICSSGGAGGDEDNPAAIGRKGGLIVVGRVVGQALKACPIGMNAVKIGRPAALRREDDPIALGRPGGVVVERTRLGERPLGGAIGIGDEECGLSRAEPVEENPVRRKTGTESTSEDKDAKGQAAGTSHRTLRTPDSGRKSRGDHITGKRRAGEWPLEKAVFCWT